MTDGRADRSDPAVVRRGVLVRHDSLRRLDLVAARDGGSVRYLRGLDHGLATSVFEAEIVPGAGPPPHHHPYAEVFVLIAGRGRYLVGDDVLDAGPGDVVIVPPGVVHSFTSVGDTSLRQTTIHEAGEFLEILRDA